MTPAVVASAVPKVTASVFAGYEATRTAFVVAQAEPGSVADLFDLIVQNGLALSLAILLVVGAFTQRISFDGKDERARRAERDKEIDAHISEIDKKLDRLIDRANG